MGQIKTFNEWVSTTTADDVASSNVIESNDKRKEVIFDIRRSFIKNNLDDYLEPPVMDEFKNNDFYWDSRGCTPSEARQTYGVFYLKKPCVFHWNDVPVKLYDFGVSYNLTCNGKQQNPIVAELCYIDEEDGADGDILSLEYDIENDSWNWITNANGEVYTPDEIDDDVVNSIIKIITLGVNPDTELPFTM
jgi:hypothetical protein